MVITDKLNLDAAGRERLEKIPESKIYEDVPSSIEEIIQKVKDAEIITAWYVDITKEIIEATQKLRYIIVPAVRADLIDQKTATEKGIKILNCPTFTSQAVAEHAIGLMFAVKRQIVQANKSIIEGEFNSKNFGGTEVKGKTLVTFGFGNIGQKVVEIATRGVY